MTKILSVQTSSLAERSGIQAGEELVSINGHRIFDPIDYRFYQAEEPLQLQLRNREGKTYFLEIAKDPDQDLGLILEEPNYRSCPNECLFCFVHQLPGGLRGSLYFKDEDYRLSFLYGNYLTLTNITSEDLNRIGEQNLSPLYISVHTTDEELRKGMLGNPKAPDLLPLLSKLADLGVELHTQVVICPGINDGKALDETVTDLARFFPQVRSLAIVPVGLTKFRERLPRLEAVDGNKALELLSVVDRWRRWARNNLGVNFLYASDELHLLAGLDIPESDYYDDFWQIENGVGLVRRFVNDFESGSALLPERFCSPLKLNFVTGRLAEGFFRETIIDRLRRIENLEVSVTVVENHFLGETVTVSGLLAGKDIVGAVRRNTAPDSIVFLPPNCVNDQGVTLDEMTIEDLSKSSGRQIVLGRYELAPQLADLFKEGVSCQHP